MSASSPRATEGGRRARQRAQFPAGEVSDDVLRAVCHQQADDIAFIDVVRRQQDRGAIHCAIKFVIAEAASVGLGKQKGLCGVRVHPLLKQFAQVAGNDL